MNLYDKASLLITPNAYKASKIYAAKPNDGSGDLTFSRASTAMRRNSAGFWETVATNVPRLHYPIGGGCPSWLLEPQRTNLITYSNEFDNAIWGKNGSSISPNLVLSPDGTQNADLFIENSANPEHYLNRPFTNQNSVFTHSIYAKKGGRDWIKIYAFASLPNDFTYIVYANFNLNTGAIGATNNCNAKIEDAGNGWFRCIMTSTTIYPQTSSAVGFLVYTCTADNTTSYLGNGSSGVYLYGAQAEAGASATSYIPTTTSNVTRVADSFSKTGLISSGILSSTGGTWYNEFSDISSITGSTNWAIGIGSNRLTFGGRTGIANALTLACYMYNSGVETAVGVTPATTKVKICFVFSPTQIKLFANGVLILTTNGTINVHLWTEFNSGSMGSWFGKLNKQWFAPTQISDAEAIAETTL
jgi:hypothetical protein